jgi:hypothetical protein
VHWLHLQTTYSGDYNKNVSERMIKYTVVACLFVVALVLQYVMVSIFNRIRDEVQVALPPAEKIPDWGPSWLRGRTLKLHRELHPLSTLRRKLYTAWITQVVVFATAVLLVVKFV